MKNNTDILLSMKFHLAVFGCQMNSNDADRIRTVLHGIEGKEVQTPEEADFVIYVTCSIRQHAEDRIFGLISNLRKQKKKEERLMNTEEELAHRRRPVIAVTGCMVEKTSSQTSDKKDKLLVRSDKIDLVFRIEDAPSLANILREYFPISDEYSGEFPGIFETLPTQTQNYSAFVPLSTGCDHHCTYCIVPHTRGKEVCRSKDEIINECKEMISRGAKEITLLGQNVNRYYFGKRRINPYRTDFAELLDEIAKLDGLVWLRFLSPHPQHLGEDVLDVMAENQNICSHLHLPVQSGDNEMLQKMARGYTVEKFKETVSLARKKNPGISVTTDVIVGFCSETEEQFQNTKRLCKEENFDMVYISKFSVRPHTPAAQWEDDVPLVEKKRRYHEINEVLKKSSKTNNMGDIGKVMKVLVDRVNDKNIAQGHTSENKIVEFQVGNKGRRFIGEFVDVKITGAKMFYLEGKIEN